MKTLTGGLSLLLTLVAWAGEFDTRVPIRTLGASTYYVDGRIDGLGPLQLMIDTGSGYTTINEQALAVLLEEDRATFRRKLRGIMADGSRKIVDVYAVAALDIADRCTIRDLEVAVFPAKTRSILGLNALNKVAPFVFSVDPPSLVLSHCQESTSPAGGEETSLSSESPASESAFAPTLLNAARKVPTP